MMDMKQKIEKIAQHYGYEAQSRQCMEECAELIQAINKLWRNQGHGQPTVRELKECRDNIVEELADVQIMIFQLAFLLNAEEIQSVINRKVDRQMERINSEKL